MAGHNKWSKIKHKKAATDAQKSKIFGKHASLIVMESRKAGGDITSPGLVAAIERAKKDSMPKENIERAVAKGSGSGGAAFEEVIFETFGPGGTAILITAVTDNNNRTAPEIRHILSKAGYQLGTPGSAAWAFTKTTEGYTPSSPVELSDVDGAKLASLIESLEEQDDVQDIYTTADALD
ncbi:MAG: YebC/PmpR family DNA-binding transcriptional regulator [Candidatus Pacebacteria bacterium]|nr:YebC/PmpR family DNA-binding transcriptional regulator [Candidatus Paceibacterota bacterium]